MNDMMRRFAFSILGLALAAPLALAHDPRAQDPRPHDSLRHRRTELRERMHWTETQRELAREKARAARPTVERFRRERARILFEAREKMRAELRELRQERRRELEPLKRPLRESLSPEQKRALEERHRTLTEERLKRSRTRR
jgi:F0F1-type ATP synthase membrane subunit b/b'